MLRGIHVFARDVAASVAFYEQTGIEFESVSRDFARAASDRATLEIGSHHLTHGYDSSFTPVAGGSTALQIGLDSREAVDEMFQKLTAAGVPAKLAPFDAFWGARYAEVRDPDGNIVGFQSPADPDRRTPPPI